MPRIAADQRDGTVDTGGQELVDLQGLAVLLREAEHATDGSTVAVKVARREFSLPVAATELLSILINALAAGEQVTITRTKRELTTTEAASILNVSRQYLVRLCDEAKLPFRWEGAHRRLALDDVLAYREMRNKERDAKFADLVRKSAEAGEYALNIAWPPQE